MSKASEVPGLVGRAFKLASSSGTILGTITIPYHWAEWLDQHRAVEFAYMDMPPFFKPSNDPVEYHVATLVLSYYDQEAIVLHGISLEEFEKRPGCAFSPGAAYLRSLVE